jgi:hypothetical protein
METAMLDQLSGAPGKKATFYAAVPLKRGAMPDEIADAIMFLFEQVVAPHRLDHQGQRWQTRKLNQSDP